MKRILFLVLWTIPLLGPQVQAGIEIDVNGHSYDSLQAYQASKKAAALSSSIPASLNNQQEDYIRQAAQKLGINVDFSKIKTFQVNQESLNDTTRHQLYVLSVENGVVSALQDFYHNRGQYDIQMPHRISSAQLQGAIQQAVTRSKDPKLLISEPGKIRIMAISPDHSKQ